MSWDHTAPAGVVGRGPARCGPTTCNRALASLTGMRLSVIGCGYLGAVHAAFMADLGHDVIGIDVDAERAASLAARGATPAASTGEGTE